MALSRLAIVDAGLGILDAYGLGDLSMRRVADVLGVQAGALYYHVPNKQSLLAALSEEVLGTVPDPLDDTDPAAWLTGWAMSLRRSLLARRDAAELVASSLALGLVGPDPTETGRALLEREGFHEPEATMATLLHFVLGHVVEEQTRAQMHALGVVGEFDAAASGARFEWGVRLIVAGAGRLMHDEAQRR